MRQRPSVRLLRAAGAAALVAGTIIAAAPTTAATAAPPKPDMPDEVIAEAREQHPDVPVETLYQRLALTAPRKHLLHGFVKAYPSTFGGSWYDYGDGVWHLFSTDAATLTTMASQARMAGIEVRPRVVAYTLQQLHDRAERINAGRDPLSAIATGAGVDVPTNRVTVATTRVRSTDPMATYVPPAKKHGPPDACTSRKECGAPLRTGVIIWHEYETKRYESCSLGFVAGAADGSRWALTARATASTASTRSGATEPSPSAPYGSASCPPATC